MPARWMMDLPGVGGIDRVKASIPLVVLVPVAKHRAKSRPSLATASMLGVSPRGSLKAPRKCKTELGEIDRIETAEDDKIATYIEKRIELTEQAVKKPEDLSEVSILELPCAQLSLPVLSSIVGTEATPVSATPTEQAAASAPAAEAPVVKNEQTNHCSSIWRSIFIE